MSISKYTFHSLLCWVLVIGFVTAGKKVKEHRKFTTEINPGCEQVYPADCSSFTNISLIHIRSDGKQDSFHFLWSFIGAPALLMARTSLESNLSVDWAGMFQADVNPTIKLEPEPLYSFGWSLVKVLMINDKNDTVSLTTIDPNDIKEYPAHNFKWERLDNQSIANTTDIKYTFTAKSYYEDDNDKLEKNRNLGPNGFFKFTIRMKSSDGYSNVLPYMLYTENGTQVDLSFNDVQLNTTGPGGSDPYPDHPRIGFKYVLVQDIENSTQKMRIEKTKTLDDEHTPGVFETYSVRTPVIHNGTDQSFIQWKPICYTAEVRDVIDSVDVWSYPLQNVSSVKDNDNIQNSILWSYYGSRIDSLLLQSMDISFGTQGDGFYNKTKHISWTYSTGFGEPPSDYVSMLVILVIAIGLGIPTVIIILSLIYVFLRRLKQPRDDLLLGR